MLNERRLDHIRAYLLGHSDCAVEDLARELLDEFDRVCDLLTDAWLLLDDLARHPETYTAAAASRAALLLRQQRAPGWQFPEPEAPR